MEIMKKTTLLRAARVVLLLDAVVFVLPSGMGAQSPEPVQGSTATQMPIAGQAPSTSNSTSQSPRFRDSLWRQLNKWHSKTILR